MATVTARISSVYEEDGQLFAQCDTGNGPGFSAVIPQVGGDWYPLPGDIVTAIDSGAEFHIVGVFVARAGAASGEHLIFARDASGKVVTSVHLKADGIAYVGGGTDFVAMAAKVDSSISAIANAISGAAVGTADGGALFKTNIMAALTPALEAIGSVASRNLKAE